MRNPYDASPVRWAVRILRPCVIASFAGICLGVGLLRIDQAEDPRSYDEPVTRAAVFDAPAVSPVPETPEATLAEGVFPPVAVLVDGVAGVPPPFSDPH